LARILAITVIEGIIGKKNKKVKMTYKFNKDREDSRRGKVYKTLDKLMAIRKGIVKSKRESLENLALFSCDLLEEIVGLALKIEDSYIGKAIKKRAIPVYLACCFGAGSVTALGVYEATGSLETSLFSGGMLAAAFAVAPFTTKSRVEEEIENKYR